MKVFVVMSNDCPDKVFATEEAADRYVEKMMEDPENITEVFFAQNVGYSRRIYYRHYEFEVEK